MTAQPVRDIPRIISVDDHVVESPTLWTDRLPSRLRERGPHIVRDTYSSRFEDGMIRFEKGGEGPMTDWWVYDGVTRAVPMVMACAGYSPDQWRMAPIAYDEMRPACYDPKARVVDMDSNHTDASLCFPNYPRFCGQAFTEARDRELALLCVKAYNDWMIDEWCGDSDGRLIPLCIVPLWDPELAAAEIRRNADRGCRAITFSEVPAYLGLPSIHAPSPDGRGHYWDPVLDACDESGTVVCMHIGSGSRMTTSSVDAPAGVSVTLTFSNAQVSLTDWLFSGAFARFPRLKIAYSEGQIGWMPYILERCDKVWLKGRGWHEDGHEYLPEPPSTYFKGHVYGCFFDDDAGLHQRDAIGLEQITFEVDYPHQDSTWPDTKSVVAGFADRCGLSDDEVRAIVRTNAIELFDLDFEP